jgi:hypothetical protein
MNQHRLFREVARATGESVGLIRQRGFSLVVPTPRGGASRTGLARFRQRRTRRATQDTPPQAR